jgi:hypothetical protein
MWQAVGLYDARHDEQRCGGARRSDGRGASKEGERNDWLELFCDLVVVAAVAVLTEGPGRVADGRLRCA